MCTNRAHLQMDLQSCLKTILKNKYQNLDHVLPIYMHHEINDGPNYEDHYTRHIDYLDNVKENSSFPLEELLKCDCNHSKSQKTILTFGACGIGKSTAVQRCALDWAEGRAHQHVDLLFVLECWELNLLRRQKVRLSLIQVLEMFYPTLKTLDANSLSKKKVWLVFDELDDYTEMMMFDCPKVKNVTKVTHVENLLPNLAEGNLLPNAHIWITTRYAGVDCFPEYYTLKGTEMRGFTDAQKDLHIRNLVGDDDLANRVINHIKISKSLYHLCKIPYMCTVMATVLKRHVNSDDYKIRPMNLTQIYSSLTEESLSDIFPLLKECLSDRNLFYYRCWIAKDLDEDVPFPVAEFTAFAHKHPLVLRVVKSVGGVPLFRFAHISVLEYFTALTILEDETADHALHLYSERFQAIVDNADQEYEQGRNDICLRFFFGLLKEKGTLQPTNPFFANIRKEILEGFFSDTTEMLFHCLREFDSQALLEEAEKGTSYLPLPDVDPENWEKVVQMITKVEGISEKFELELSLRCDERVLKSLCGLQKSRQAMLRFSNLSDHCCPALASVLGTRESNLRDLDLGFNSITDAGVQSLVQGLKAQGCRLKSLRLQGCELTSSACEHLALALKLSPNLTELDLSSNDIGDLGLQQLAKGLQSPKCQLQTLRLSQCNIKKKGGFHLASALGKNPNHLKWLDLSINIIGDKAANELFTRFDISRLTKLEMYYCGLTAKCCDKISDALKFKESSLVELNLSSNDLKDEGVQLISVGLFAWSRLETLNLLRCGITDAGCFFLSKVMRCISALYRSDMHLEISWQTTKLRELNLSMNKFADNGAINISTGFKNPYSHLRKIDLSECGFTSECCSDMAAQLDTCECPIYELNLSSNNIQDKGIKRLCEAFKSPECPLQKLYLRNCGLTSKCVSFLNTALKTNLHLRDLFLMGNKLDDSAIETLVRITKNNSYKLQSVDVSVD